MPIQIIRNAGEVIGINPDGTISAQDPRSDLDRFRYPDIIVSDGYLNDPIRFQVDDRFRDYTVVSQSTLPTGSATITRDFAEFLTIDRNNSGSQALSINMVSPYWRRAAYEKVVGPRAQFTQFDVAT